MSRRNLIFPFVLIISLVAAIWPIVVVDALPQAATRSDAMHDLVHVLEDGGLIVRSDVRIRVSGQTAAWGFSKRGCDGLLLLSILPETAQSWAHIAPGLGRPAYTEIYLQGGIAYDSVPIIERLKDSMLSDLVMPNRDVLTRSVVALAEQGACELATRAQELIRTHIEAEKPSHHRHKVATAT